MSSFQIDQQVWVVWPAVNVRRTPGYLDKPSNDVCGGVKEGDRVWIAGYSVYKDNICWWKIEIGGNCGGEGWIGETRNTGDTLLRSSP